MSNAFHFASCPIPCSIPNGCVENYKKYAHAIYSKLVLQEGHTAAPTFPSALKICTDPIETVCLEQGVMLYSLDKFIALYPTLASRSIFDQQESRWHNRSLGAYIDSHWTVGIVLFIPTAVQVINPIDIRSLLQKYRWNVAIEKCFVIIEAHARATIIDGHSGTSDYFLRSVEYRLADYASLVVHGLHTPRPHAWYEAVWYTVHPGKHSTVEFIGCMASSAATTIWIDVFAQQQYGAADVRIVAPLLNGTKMDIITAQNHTVSSGSSNILVKSCVSGVSSFYYYGSIHIPQQAPKTTAHQRNINLLFGDNSTAKSFPVLEVLANDVVCSHASAIGQLDSKQIFYIMARGLSAHQAQRLIIDAFCTHVLESMKTSSCFVEAQNVVDGFVEELLL